MSHSGLHHQASQGRQKLVLYQRKRKKFLWEHCYDKARFSLRKKTDPLKIGRGIRKAIPTPDEALSRSR